MKLALVDLDGTLIDDKYHLAIEGQRFRAAVAGLAGKGVLVGLCSDSAVITLRQWAGRLGMRAGPIVAECGAVVCRTCEEKGVLVDPARTGWFEKFREGFVTAALANFPAQTYVGDATKHVMKKHARTLENSCLAVNGHRIGSFNLFARDVSEDGYRFDRPDPLMFKYARDLARRVAYSFVKTLGDLRWDENPGQGYLCVHAQTTRKGQGVAKLVETLKPEQLAMIGNSLGDLLDLPGAAQFAVANADGDYKDKCSFVAQRTLAEGVLECLEQFA